jgi:hypothetical protein
LPQNLPRMLDRFVPHGASVHLPGQPATPSAEKPGWIDALEESLLLAIGLFALVTWIVTIAIVSH